MDWLFDGIGDWIKQLFIDGIMASFSTIFDEVNHQVTDIATQVGQTPEGWNSGVFSMIRTLSETVVIPIAGMILTFVLCYELIQLIIERNNLQDFDTFNLYKWIFKTFVAVFILTNTFNIVMGVFDIGQHVVNQSAGLIGGSLTLGDGATMDTIRASLEAMEIGELLGLFFEVQVVRLCMLIMSIVIMIIVWGRMIEIYLTVSIAPIPFSTMVNKEWSSMGNNYLKALFALAFQGFLIMVCVAIYAVLVAGIAVSDNMHVTIWMIAGYTAFYYFAVAFSIKKHLQGRYRYHFGLLRDHPVFGRQVQNHAQRDFRDFGQGNHRPHGNQHHQRHPREPRAELFENWKGIDDPR